MIAIAADVTRTPQAMHFFGKEMVLHRGKGSGRRILLDAFCSHMHLATNTTSYTVEERAGCIFMWHDMEGGAPDFELPALDEWDRMGGGWVRWTPDHLGTLPIHPQEILDNMSDIAHFAPVHGSTGTVYFENVYEGPIMRQRFGSGHLTLVDCNTPVRDGEVRVWFAIMAKTADSHEPTREESAIVRAYHESGLAASAQDFELWQHKEPEINVLQVPDDGPFHKGRIWYRQFFHPRVRAAEFQNRVNGSHVTLRGKGKVMEVA